MFEAMGIDTAGETWRVSAERHFERALAEDEVVAVVVDAPDGGLAATGVIEFLQWIPSTSQPVRASRLHLQHVDGCCMAAARTGAAPSSRSCWPRRERRDIERIELHATAEGVGLYRSVGFVPREGNPAMRLAEPLG